jgi:hypothetical protein
MRTKMLLKAPDRVVHVMSYLKKVVEGWAGDGSTVSPICNGTCRPSLFPPYPIAPRSLPHVHTDPTPTPTRRAIPPPRAPRRRSRLERGNGMDASSVALYGQLKVMRKPLCYRVRYRVRHFVDHLACGWVGFVSSLLFLPPRRSCSRSEGSTLVGSFWILLPFAGCLDWWSLNDRQLIVGRVFCEEAFRGAYQ